MNAINKFDAINGLNAINGLEAQHDAMAGMMLRLVNLVEGFQGPDQAYAITVHLTKLADLLRRHLATEDEWFYPAMMHSDDRAPRRSPPLIATKSAG